MDVFKQGRGIMNYNEHEKQLKKRPDYQVDVETLKKRLKKRNLIKYIIYMLGVLTCHISIIFYFLTFYGVISLMYFIVGIFALYGFMWIAQDNSITELLIYLKEKEGE
jgi:hypothetical protein